MKTNITQFGDAPVILLDNQLLKLAKLEVGHPVNVEVCADGTITLEPINPESSSSQRTE